MLVLLFKALGILVLCYVARSYVRGEVYGRSHFAVQALRQDWIRGRTYRRDSAPFAYWSWLVIYSVLAVALFFFVGRL